MLTIWRLFTTPHSTRKWRHIGRSQRRSGKRHPPQALTPRGKLRSPTRRRTSLRTKAKAVGTSRIRDQKSEIGGAQETKDLQAALAQFAERSEWDERYGSVRAGLAYDDG